MTQQEINQINKDYALQEALINFESGELTSREYENVLSNIEENYEED